MATKAEKIVESLDIVKADELKSSNLSVANKQLKYVH